MESFLLYKQKRGYARNLWLEIVELSPKNQRNGVPFEKDLWNLVDKLKFRENKRQLPETVKQRYKGYQTIKQSSSIRR